MSQVPSTPAALVRVDDRLQARSVKRDLDELDDDDLAFIGETSSRRSARQRLRTLGGFIAVGVGAVALFQIQGNAVGFAAMAMAAAFGFGFQRIHRRDATTELVEGNFEPALAAELGRAAADLPWTQLANTSLPTSARDRGAIVVEAVRKIRSSSVGE